MLLLISMLMLCCCFIFIAAAMHDYLGSSSRFAFIYEPPTCVITTYQHCIIEWKKWSVNCFEAK